MTPPPSQLALDLAGEPAYGRDDFLVSPSNEVAFAFIDDPRGWPVPCALLIGPPGSGKSHLASIFAAGTGAHRVSAASLQEAGLPALLGNSTLVVEDADRAPDCETELFHLLNLARETGTTLLLTARTAPSHWGVRLPDLMSRLRLLPIVEIAAPDDALLRAVIVKHFVDRQLAIDTSVVDYLARHIDRSLDAARAIVAAIDIDSLARGRRVTRAMAAAVLAATSRLIR